VVAIFTERLLKGAEASINGDGKQTRDYVYVGDVAAANVAALEADFVGPVNIGLGVETDVNRLFALLRDAAGSTAQPTHGPAKPGEQRRSVIDPARARRVLGWTPRVQLADGLREVVAFFRARNR
jgi:UDP-glucose 4-epimerase